MVTLLAIDVGGTYIKYGAADFVDSTGVVHLLWTEQVATHASSGRDAVLALITNIVHTLLQRHPTARSVGIGVPGVVDPLTRCVQHPPNLAGWDHVDLRKHIYQSPLPNPSVTVHVENDANCGAIAELYGGAGRGLSDFVYVTLGTGIGGGLVVNNKLFTGPFGEAGELGHLIVEVASPQQRGTMWARKLEEVIGRAGIVSMYGNTQVDVAEIDRRANEGEQEAIHVLRTAGTILGESLASALAVLGIRNVIVGGGISRSAILLSAAEQALRQIPIPTIAASLQFRKAEFEDHAGLVGAALLGVA